MAIVYIHRRNDIQDLFLNVFYVGIGKNEKRAYSKHGRNKHWNNIINKHGYNVEITHSNICWEEACIIEKYLISFYGRLNLANKTDGGEGTNGFKHKSETKKIFSEQRMGSKNHRFGKKMPDKIKYIFSQRMIEINKYNNPTKGKKRPNYVKKLLSDSKKGAKNPNFGKTGDLSMFSKKVYKIDIKTKEILCQYNSCKTAAKENNVYVNSIYKCCAGVNKTAGGYVWGY